MNVVASLIMKFMLDKIYMIYRENAGTGYSYSIKELTRSVLNADIISPYIAAETESKKLVAVHIGSQVAAISAGAFTGALNLTDVYIHNEYGALGIADGAFNPTVNFHYDFTKPSLYVEIQGLLDGQSESNDLLTAISPLSEDIVCVDVDGTFYINPAETPDGLLAVFIPKTETYIDVATYAGHWRRAPGSGVELKRIYVHNSPENVAIYSGETEIEAPLDYIYFTEISHAYLTGLAARVAALEGQMSGVDAANAELESVLNGTYVGGENE
jgi:hypothetical protein